MKEKLISFKETIFSLKLVIKNVLRTSEKKNLFHLLGSF